MPDYRLVFSIKNKEVVVNVLFCSCGNDSVALIQHAKEKKLKDVTVMYTNTGWAIDWWDRRVQEVKELAISYGFKFIELETEGLISLVTKMKCWPRQGMQFCTAELKIKPALKWLEENDADLEADCLVGVRREESANRASFPEWVEESDRHGGRSLWAPLVRMNEKQRNELIEKTGLEILKHRSMECFPCVNSNKADLRMLSNYESRIKLIESTEKEMGFTKKGKARTMFRPYRHMGATGIREASHSTPNSDAIPANGITAGIFNFLLM